MTAVGLAGSRANRDNQRCCDIDILVVDSAINMFTTSEDIERTIDVEFGGYRNRLVDSVNLHKLEKVIKKHKYIDKCCAYFTSDGMLHLSVSQCTPVIKLENDSTKWYLDGNGECFPIARDWSTDLISVKGHPRVKDRIWTARVAAMAGWINSDSRWKGRVTTAYSASNGEISLGLKGRNERFLIGQPVKIREKFNRMNRYLESIASDSTGKEYRSVNVKYYGQIVCK